MARQLDNRVFIMPPMKDENWGVFHSKLMLLFHTSSVRVVIGSANLVLTKTTKHGEFTADGD